MYSELHLGQGGNVLMEDPSDLTVLKTGDYIRFCSRCVRMRLFPRLARAAGTRCLGSSATGRYEASITVLVICSTMPLLARVGSLICVGSVRGFDFIVAG
ncbi:hypothetical protein D3C77_669630 [compost metagenome]